MFSTTAGTVLLLPLLVLVAVTFPAARAVQTHKHTVVAAYVPEYRTGIDWNFYAQHVTDLILFSVEPLENGTIKSYFPIDDDGSDSALTKAHAAQQQSIGSPHLLPNSKGLNLLLCVGGAGRSKYFSTVTSTKKKRTEFLTNLRNTLVAKQLNGLDFDWEVPSTRQEVHQYQLLLQEAGALLHATPPKDPTRPPFILSATVHAWQDLGKPAYDALDRIHLMSYDGQGTTHSSYAMAQQDVRRLAALHCPLSKIVLGVPFYGRGLVNPGLTLTYEDLVKKVGADLNPMLDVMGTGKNKIGFNNVLTVQKKMKFAIQSKILGVFAWEIGQDSSDGETSLTKAISDVRMGIKRKFHKKNPAKDPRFSKKLKEKKKKKKTNKKKRIKRNFDL